MTTAVTQCSGDCLVNDCVEVTSRSTTRESLLKPLARLLSVLMGPTKQASFHTFIDLRPVWSMRSMDVSGILCVHAVGDHMVSYIGAHPSSL